MSSRLERVNQICSEISRGRYPSVQALCEKFEVKERTIFADLKFIRESIGIPVDFDHFRGGYYNSDPTKKLPAFELTKDELLALELGKQMLSQYAGPAFQPPLEDALEKIMERVPQNVQESAMETRFNVKFDPIGVIPVGLKTFVTLNAACANKKQVELTYYAASSGETTVRIVDPYKLLENRDVWYLVAYCHLRNDYRLFALHRIKDYRVLEESFTPSPGFDVDKWVDSAFLLEHGDDTQIVKVHFRPPSARYIRERTWQDSQVLTEHDDGSCTLQFRTTSLDEAKRWVLTYGCEAEVLEPQVLRELVRQELVKATQVYSA